MIMITMTTIELLIIIMITITLNGCNHYNRLLFQSDPSQHCTKCTYNIPCSYLHVGSRRCLNFL